MRWARARPDRPDQGWLRASREARGKRAGFCNPAHRASVGGPRSHGERRAAPRAGTRPPVIWGKGHCRKYHAKAPIILCDRMACAIVWTAGFKALASFGAHGGEVSGHRRDLNVRHIDEVMEE